MGLGIYHEKGGFAGVLNVPFIFVSEGLRSRRSKIGAKRKK